MVELKKIQEQLHLQVPKGIDFSSMIDVELGRVQLEVPTAADLQRAESQVPEAVHIIVEGAPALPASIYGGLALDPECTTGFSVDEISGFQQGILTAGHCQNTMAYGGQNLPFQDGQQNGNTDAQWHTTPNLSDPNKFYSGFDTRPVLNVWSRAETAVNTSLCKYGRTTGYTCFSMTNKDYDPPESCITNSSDTWMYGYSGSGQIVAGNDSGGPVSKNNGAYGLVVCRRTVDPGDALIYMASNFTSNVGARIASD